MNIVVKSIFLQRAFTLLLILTALTACHDEMIDYKQTVRSGINGLPWPKQMEALFGEGDHFITEYDYGRSPGPKTWNTVVYFGGRYELTMQVDVEIDYGEHVVKKYVSPPKFYLVEVESVKRRESGAVEGRFSNQWIFDEAKWRKLVEAKGDWSAIGIPVKKDSPLPGFDEYVKAWREPRVRVEH